MSRAQAQILRDPPPVRGLNPLTWFIIGAIVLALTLLGEWVYRTTR